MKGLLKYDAKYGIDKDWVNRFRKVLLSDLHLYYQKENEMVLKYKGKMWILTNNGLEFNLTMVNLFDHPSYPYVENKRAIDPEEMASKITAVIKEDYKVQKITKDSVDILDRALSQEDAEYLDNFLNETRGNYEQ